MFTSRCSCAGRGRAPGASAPVRAPPGQNDYQGVCTHTHTHTHTHTPEPGLAATANQGPGHRRLGGGEVVQCSHRETPGPCPGCFRALCRGEEETKLRSRARHSEQTQLGRVIPPFPVNSENVISAVHVSSCERLLSSAPCSGDPSLFLHVAPSFWVLSGIPLSEHLRAPTFLLIAFYYTQ